MRDYASLYSLLLDELGLANSGPGPITSDMDTRSVAANSLASSFYKKLAPGGNTKDADARALKKFLAINESIPSTPFRFEAGNEAESCFYDYFKDNLRVTLEPHPFGTSFDLEYIREHMNVGPGAAQKADSSHMVSKLFESTMSYGNSDLIKLYRSALAETGLWADAEMQRNQRFGFVKVRGCKIFFAPKNAEISRTCGTPANLEMLFQKACGAFLEERLEKCFGISLSTQPDFNREFARIGSLNGTFGTIDLVSASDSISLQLCLDAIPNCPLKTMMMKCRDERAVLPSGEEVELKMISTMGNGFTFPLQTVIFASAVRAVYQIMGFPCRDPRTEFGVFGDDIVVRREAYYFLCQMLNKLGFEVNVGKSFNTGQFRESCGMDYYNGTNVRGVYIQSLETPQEVYSAFNRLTRWSAVHGIKINKVLAQLMKWARFIPIPPSEADDAGICVPWKLSKSTKVNNSYWFKYRCYVAKRKKLQIAECDAEGVINPFGQAVGRLAGHIRRREISLTEPYLEQVSNNLLAGLPPFSSLQEPAAVSLRSLRGARTRYKVATRYLPYWDYWPLTKLATSDPKTTYHRTKHGEWSYDDNIERVSLPRGSQEAWEGILVELAPTIVGPNLR